MQRSAAGLVTLEPSGEESWPCLPVNFLGGRLGRWSLWRLSGVARVGGRDRADFGKSGLWR